ncbi:MAG: hypothetical protein O2955_02400 [Planctomycetota bacterium]|nr:hypothetical protein [Planctomycetota bacterium]MDA1211335.1 hypothetical protein [Planctomycetota bacterium]
MFRPPRFHFRLSLFLTLFVGVASTLEYAWADEPTARSDRPTAPLAGEVRLLIDDLQSDKRSVRVAAEAALRGRGPAILPLLPSPETLANAAARESIRRIRILLEKEHAEELAKGSSVTLGGEFMLADIVDEITRQTGNIILLDDLDETARVKIFSVAFEKTPFWQAWDELLRKTETTARFDRHASALRLLPIESPVDVRVDDLHPVKYAGPFRLEITSVQRIDQIGNAKPQRLRLNVNLHAEPRLRPLFLKYATADIILSGTEGREIPSATPTAKWDLPWGVGETGIDLRWDFLIPQKMPATELNCRGVIQVELASGTERFVFDDLASEERLSQRRGGVIVALESTTTETIDNRSRTGIRISVQYDAGGPAFESHRNWMFHNHARLISTTEKSQPIVPDAFVTERQGDGTYMMTYRFDNLSGDVHDYQFEYRAPTLLLMVPVHFSFSMIDLPEPEAEK